MKKVKLNEVPKDYRRNYKEEFVEFLGMLGVCFMFFLCIVCIFWLA